ncbi:murein biosynthesis integral membrane protein MurJ [Candidatus Uhrbacteria bacterium]|nr:murein biosynthesis integral membrane protein MurJ [Candidatus Uhrbacteria bacterium]
MVSRIFGVKSKTVGSAAILLSVASLASRLFGLVRDRLLAGTFGAGPELDAYYAAFRMPDLIYNLFVFGAISAAFIPVFSRFSDDGEGSNREANELVSRILTVLAIGLTLLAVLGFVFAPFFTPLIAPGFDGPQIGLTVRLTRIMFLSPVMLGLSGVFGAVLQVRKRFLVYALAPILYNVGIIIGILAFTGRWGVDGWAWGVVLGALMHFAVQAVACRRIGMRFRPIVDLRHSGIREIVRLTIPRIASLSVSSFQLLVITSMITALGVGSLAVYNLGLNLVYVPINMIGISVAVAAFPFISELAERGRVREMAEAVSRAVRNIMFFAVPATVGFLLLRAQIVRVILGSRRFDWTDTVMTADVLACLSLGLFASALLPILVRAFFALHDSRTPLKVNVICAAFGVLFAWIAVQMGYGVVGVAASVSLASALNLTVLWVALRIRLGDLGEVRIFRSVAIMSLGGLAMALVTQAVKMALGSAVDMRSFAGIFTQGLTAGLAGLGAYFGMSVLLGSGEAMNVVGMVRCRLSPVPLSVSQKEESLVPEP